MLWRCDSSKLTPSNSLNTIDIRDASPSKKHFQRHNGPRLLRLALFISFTKVTWWRRLHELQIQPPGGATCIGIFISQSHFSWVSTWYNIRTDIRTHRSDPTGITGPIEICGTIKDTEHICVIKNGNVKFAVSSSFLPHSWPTFAENFSQAGSPPFKNQLLHCDDHHHLSHSQVAYHHHQPKQVNWQQQIKQSPNTFHLIAILCHGKVCKKTNWP